MKLFKFFNDKSDRPSDTVNGPEIDRNGVMIVDDSRFSRNVLRDILENEGFEVVGEAGDGQEAIDKTKELSPEIIFLDVEMPVMDGLGALSKIMKHDPGISVIMCTALGQKKIIMEATRAGAKDYVIKPYRKESITDVLIPYKEAKAEVKAKAKAEAEAKAKAEAEAFFEVEGYVDTEESAEESVVEDVEDVEDATIELENTDSDEMGLLDYSSEEETLDQMDLGETLGSVYELDTDSLEGTEDSEISDTTEEDTIPLFGEFEELVSEEPEEEDYEATLILDGIEEVEEIEEVLEEEIEDVEEKEEILEEVEDLEEVLEEEQQEEVEDLEEILEEEAEEIEEVIEEEIEDMETPEEAEDLWAGVFDKPETEEIEDAEIEEEIEVSAMTDDSTNYAFVYLNRFDTQLEGTIRKATLSSKKISIDFKPSKTEGLSELLGKSDSKRLIMLGMMNAYMLQSDERTNTNNETPAIKLSIKSNENRRYVQDVFGQDVHVEELSMQDILSKVNFTDVSSIKLDDKSGLGLHCAITDLVTKYNQRELFII